MKTLKLKEETFKHLLSTDKYRVDTQGRPMSHNGISYDVVDRKTFKGYKQVMVIGTLRLEKLQSDVYDTYQIEPNDDLTDRMALIEQHIVTPSWNITKP